MPSGREASRTQDAKRLFYIPTRSVTAIKLRSIRSDKNSFRRGCEK
ncbi:Uncharacterized protein dnm_043430 [Desulfonema magnum]|uniref:Uncharacterized protein n=1 Tax=Desulfonema magnum TaxID=45655 RepID=A0A975BNS0_9BACT|nr:Uncharacterized protein dnm_043430 [Desulfonema magnum]